MRGQVGNSGGANVLLDYLARWTRRSTRRKETENQPRTSIRLTSRTGPDSAVDPISTQVPVMTLLTNRVKWYIRCVLLRSVYIHGYYILPSAPRLAGLRYTRKGVGG